MGKLTKEAVEGCRFLNERSCTDCCMIPLALLFIGGWIAVAIVAYLNGNPEVLILPTDTNGAICGMGDLSDFPSGFYPKPSTLQIALCVASCPVIGSIVCDATLQPRTLLPNSVNTAESVRNHFYNMTASEYAVGAAAITICSTGVNALCDTALFNQAERARGAQDRINTANCYVTAYPSRAVVHRCVPLVSAFQNNTLVSGPVTVESLRTSFSELTAGQFFILGFGEVETGWIVIAICVGASVVLSMLWILVMRWIMAPVVYLSLLMVLAGFVGLGLLSRDNYLKLEMLEINGDSGVRNQRILWETIQYLAFILAGVFVLLFLWLLKRIRISIELLKEGGRAFLSTPTLLFVPIFVTAGLLGIVAFFVSLTLYIQSIGTFTSNEVQVLTDNRLFSQIAATIPVNATTFDPNVSSRWLHLYNFFGFLWFSNYLIMEGLFIITMAACVWYFSATRDAEAAANQRLKFTPVGTLCRAFYISLRYHLGSVLFGALLIAIIQFIRAILTYVQQQLSRHFGNNSTYRIVMCCVNCCLWCLERIVKLISSTAFVIVCIKDTNFCSSCITALRVLTENVLRVGTLTTVSFLITTLLKILIAVSTTILGWGLLQVPQLLFRDGVIESGLFPLVFIFIVAYVIATMFISVYENCVDAIMICFFVDEMELEGQFLPKQLSKLVGMVADVQKAKKEFEEKAKKIDEESK